MVGCHCRSMGVKGKRMGLIGHCRFEWGVLVSSGICQLIVSSPGCLKNVNGALVCSVFGWSVKRRVGLSLILMSVKYVLLHGGLWLVPEISS